MGKRRRMMSCYIFLIFILSIIGSASAVSNNENIQTIANPCPHDWVQATWVSMGCLKLNTTTDLTWYEANLYCQQIENASLVEIQNEEQHEFLIMRIVVNWGSIIGGQLLLMREEKDNGSGSTVSLR